MRKYCLQHLVALPHAVRYNFHLNVLYRGFRGVMHGRAAELQTIFGRTPGATSGTLLSAVKWPVAAAKIAKTT